MTRFNNKNRIAVTLTAVALLLAVVALFTRNAEAATPGITGTTFNLVATPNYITQPDGMTIYSWGYGCASTYKPTFAPAAFTSIGFCPTMQVPGPTLIVTEGQTVTVTLTNNLPGLTNASIVFPGFSVTASGGTPGLMTNEATPGGGTVTYTFVASKPGTRAYYSGTQPDFQIEMGMYGAIVVLPANPPSNCTPLGSDIFQHMGIGNPGGDLRLAPAAYDHPETCYDREYLFQFMELDSAIHKEAEAEAQAIANCVPANQPAGVPCPATFNVPTEPYHPNYFLINGRSMPDDMDSDYAPNYPNQPYNGNPHMHPGDLVLLRTIGQGRWQHPFHQHGNHTRILARDGNLILSQNDPLANSSTPARLAGRMEFTTDTYPGQSFDGIFYWSGKGLGWDIYGHTPNYAVATQPCYPDANGYYTVNSSPPAPTNAVNYYEWCADHNHPLETNPLGTIGAGGPATQFDPLVATNGLWYNGTPYLSEDAVVRNRGNTPQAPGFATQNPLPESGIAFMWHSHNEREITTNDVFPGGMLMIMLVDPPVWFIDETL
jgi:FtsP/CotA-like multicopper oxidase with cupredoxin domain